MGLGSDDNDPHALATNRHALGYRLWNVAKFATASIVLERISSRGDFRVFAHALRARNIFLAPLVNRNGSVTCVDPRREIQSRLALLRARRMRRATIPGKDERKNENSIVFPFSLLSFFLFPPSNLAGKKKYSRDKYSHVANFWI